MKKGRETSAPGRTFIRAVESDSAESTRPGDFSRARRPHSYRGAFAEMTLALTLISCGSAEDAGGSGMRPETRLPATVSPRVQEPLDGEREPEGSPAGQVPERESPGGTDAPVSIDCRPPYTASTPPDGITLELESSHVVLKQGEPLGLTIRVKNSGVVPVDNTQPSGGPPYDFWIEQDGKTVWRWKYKYLESAVIVRGILAPGEEKRGSVTWDQKVCLPASEPRAFGNGPPDPGRFVARASWRTTRRDGGRYVQYWWTDPVVFTIVE